MGYGDVGQNKFTPALVSFLEQSINQEYRFLAKGETLELAIVDVNRQKSAAVAALKRQAQQRHLNLEPVFVLDVPGRTANSLERVFARHPVDVAYIASPNPTHTYYLDLLLRKAKRIYVEKPLADHISEIEALEQKYQTRDFPSVRLFDHYLMKAPVLEFFQHYERYLDLVGQLQRVDFSLVESGVIEPTRSWLYGCGMIRDLAVHFLSILFKLHELGWSTSAPENLQLVEVSKAQYDAIPPHIDNPKETAARLRFRLGGVDARCIVGKGAGFTRKELRFLGAKGTLVVNTQEGSIALTTRQETHTLFPTKAMPTFSEHWHLVNGIFNCDADIGLPYHLARAQIGAMEGTDQTETAVKYDVGHLPFSF